MTPDSSLYEPDERAGDGDDGGYAGSPGRSDSVADDSHDWKGELRRRFEEALASMSDASDPDDESDRAEIEMEKEIEGDLPDLYSFHEQLTVLSAESRRSNRRMAETLSRWGEILDRFEKGFHRSIESMSEISRDPTPTGHWLALAEVYDRMRRIQSAFESPPPPGWFTRNSRLLKAWNNQRHGFGILLDHMAALLAEAGIAQIPTRGQRFEPHSMAAVESVERNDVPEFTVVEEVETGYRRGNQVLRLAQVKVSKRPAGPDGDSDDGSGES